MDHVNFNCGYACIEVGGILVGNIPAGDPIGSPMLAAVALICEIGPTPRSALNLLSSASPYDNPHV